MTRKAHVLRWLDAVRDGGLRTSAVAVAAIAATFADYGTGESMRAGTVRIARGAGLRVRAARYALRELEEAGLIEWDGRPTSPGTARVYRLTIPERRHVGAAVADPTNRERRHVDAAERRHETTGTAAPTCPLPIPNQETADGARVSTRSVRQNNTHDYADADGTCARCHLPADNARHRVPTHRQETS